LDPDEKVVELGSRSFFLCSKAAAASSYTCPTEAREGTAAPADRPSNMLPPWLGFVHFWPLL